MLRQPGLELAGDFDFFLQGLEGLHARRQVGLARALLVHRLLARAAVFVELGHGLLQLEQHGLGHFSAVLRAGKLRLQVRQAGLVGGGQCVAVGAQALVARLLLAALFVDAALLGGQHLDLLLHLHHGGALRGGARLRLAQRIFQVGQARGLLLHLGGEYLGLLLGVHACAFEVFHLGSGFFAARGPLRSLLGQLRQALLNTLAAFDHVADLGFELANLGRGLVELALGLVHRVARSVVGLADGFQIGLDMAQLGHARFQVVHGLQALGTHAVLFFLGVGALEEPELVLLERHVLLQGVVARRDLGLLFEPLQIGVQLAQDVLNAREVLARIVQAVFRLAPALFVLGDPRRLLQEQAQLLRAAFDDAADGALANDGVCTRAQPRAQEHVLHVAAAHRLVVDVVAAVAVAREHALDGNLPELAPLPAGAVVAVVERELHAGAAGRLAAGGAVEDHVLHALATQLAGFALAQHPAHGIHDVGLAAAVRPHHAHQLPGQHEVGGLGEGLEAGELDGLETHGAGRCEGGAWSGKP